jgi:hypothetical protein
VTHGIGFGPGSGTGFISVPDRLGLLLPKFTAEERSMPTTRKLFALILTLTVLALPAPPLRADVTGEERDLAFLVDVGLLRPVGLVVTAVGVVAFVALLPLSIPTLSVEKSFDILVKNPASYTFYRELGGDDYNSPERYEERNRPPEAVSNTWP